MMAATLERYTSLTRALQSTHTVCAHTHTHTAPGKKKVLLHHNIRNHATDDLHDTEAVVGFH